MYKFTCCECNYKTNLKGDYKRHLNSMKHQRNITIKDLELTSEEFLMKGEQKRNKKEQKGTKCPKKGTKKEQKGTFFPDPNDNKLKVLDINICNYCHKTYATRKTLLRHQKHYCTIKKEEKK